MFAWAKNRGTGVVMAATAMMFVGSGIAAAGTNYDSYTVYVPKSNGSAWTYAQTVALNNLPANLQSKEVGGGYVLDVRYSGLKGYVGGWSRQVNDNDSRQLSRGGAPVGNSGQLEFSSFTTTPVQVRAYGTWRSN